jgi:hypothetical protein
MSRIALTANLYLDEYIPKELYLKYEKNPTILIGLLDRRLIYADQKLREHFGPVTINNWYIDGDRNWSGLRTSASSDYSPTSQHSFGRASDKLFKAPAEDVRKYIQENWQSLGITCIESGVSWVHSDVRFYNQGSLLIVHP